MTADNPDNVRLTRSLLMDLVGDAVKESSDAVDDDARWDSLVVSDQTMAKLKQISQGLRNMEARMKQGIEPLRGAILFGPPGTGKTQIAKTLANESGVSFFSKKPSDLKSSYQAGAGKNVRMAFDEARTKAPCILFLDEFESIATARGQSHMNDEMVTELLVQMEGAKKSGKPVFVLAATNHLEKIDGAVLDRLSEKIEVPYPTEEQRARLLTVFLSKYRQVDFDVPTVAAELASRTGDVGGRDIRQLVIRASQDAAQRAEEAGTPDRIVLTRDDLLKQFAPKGEKVTEDQIQKVWSEIVLKPEVKESLLGMIRLFNTGDKAAAEGPAPLRAARHWQDRDRAEARQVHGLQVPRGQALRSQGWIHRSERPAGEGRLGQGPRVRPLRDVRRRVRWRLRTARQRRYRQVQRRCRQQFPAGVGRCRLHRPDLVVGATNRLDRFDDAIISRFGTPIEIGLPDAAQRVGDPQARDEEARARRRGAGLRRARHDGIRRTQARRVGQDGLHARREERRRERRGVARGHRHVGESDELRGGRERELGLADSSRADDPRG